LGVGFVPGKVFSGVAGSASGTAFSGRFSAERVCGRIGGIAN
jgi:hypothetical protein